MREVVYEKIKQTRKLPSPTGVALEILRLTEDPYVSSARLSEVIETDPALAGKLLRLVNSAFIGLPQKVGSVRAAVGLLGLQKVRQVVLTFSLIASHRQGACRAFDYEGFWTGSLGRAVASRTLARRTGDAEPDEAFTCGLLLQIGRLALATAFPEPYAELLEAAGSADPDELLETESQMFGIHHYEIGACMMRDWHLPESFALATEHHTAVVPDALHLPPAAATLTRHLQWAAAICRAIAGDAHASRWWKRIATEAERLGWDETTITNVLEVVRHEWQEAGRIFAIDTTGIPPVSEIYVEAQRRLRMLAPQAAEDLATQS